MCISDHEVFEIFWVPKICYECRVAASYDTRQLINILCFSLDLKYMGELLCRLWSTLPPNPCPTPILYKSEWRNRFLKWNQSQWWRSSLSHDCRNSFLLKCIISRLTKYRVSAYPVRRCGWPPLLPRGDSKVRWQIYATRGPSFVSATRWGSADVPAGLGSGSHGGALTDISPWNWPWNCPETCPDNSTVYYRKDTF